jgi:NAD(P)-dependent dehydrogenase (short-subunit alcohol dehydrogenase family)
LTRSILVTGAGGGLGGATAQLFAARGWQVFAGDVRPPAPSPGVVPLELDVTSTASIEAAIKQVDVDAPHGLDAVVNFAGVLVVGALVDVDEEAMRRILDINVLGTFRVNKAAFELVRRGKGRIVNISSETGWQRALMVNGPYAISKHAVEAYSDALRRELMFVGVPVVVIQPGPFRTSMVGDMAQTFERAVVPGSPFESLVRRVARGAVKEQGKANDPTLLAEAVWTAVTDARPRTHYSVKPDRTRAVLNRLPVRVVDALLRRGLS